MVKGRMASNSFTSTPPGAKELKQSLERLQALMEEIPTGVINVDIKGKITYVNKTILQSTGYSREELVGKNGLKLGLIPPETMKLLAKRMKEKLMGKPPSPLEIQFKHKDGRWMWIEITGRTLWEHGVPVGVQVVGKDITERKQAEEALRESEGKYRTIFENVSDVIIHLNKYGKVIDVNKRIEDYFGYKQEEVIGKNFAKLGVLGPKDLPKMLKLFGEAVRGKLLPLIEVEAKRKDGSTALVEVNTTFVKRDGKIEGTVAIIRDITKRRQAEEALSAANEELRAANEELRQTQEQLVRSEKLAAIGQLAGGVGHELRNPLGAIKNAVYYVKGKVAKSELAQEEPRLMEFLDIMDEEINSSNKIVGDLLEFSRVQKPSVSPTGIEKVIEDTLSRTPIPENIELTKKLDGELPEVNIDPDQIQQVFVNIITNAVQAMPEGGKLTVDAREKDKFVEVEVADTGCGIPQETVGKIFDPLFTTRAKGIGLGLAVCKSIIDRHEGNITVKSKVGKGTTISIKLPLESE